MASTLTTLRKTLQPTPETFLAAYPGCRIVYSDDTAAEDPAKALSSESFDPVVTRGQQQQRCGVHFCIEPSQGVRTKGGIGFINLGIDVDLVGKAERPIASALEIDRRKDEYLQRDLLPFPLKPHALIETRQGFQVLFRVQGMADADGTRAAEEVNRRLAGLLKGDDRPSPLAQAFRVPGTYQFTAPQQPFQCRLLLDNASTVAPHDLQAVRSVLDAGEVFHAAGADQPPGGPGGVPTEQGDAVAVSDAEGILGRSPAILDETGRRDGLEERNRQGAAPLPERDLPSTFESVALRERGKSPGGSPQAAKDEADEPDGQSQAEKIVAFLTAKHTTLFHDQFREPHAHLSVGGHWETVRIRGREFEQWLSQQLWQSERCVASPQAMRTAITTLGGIARFRGARLPLEVRVARQCDVLWYDLADPARRAVRVTAEGWQVVANPPILFRRFPHQLPQVTPLRGGSLDLLRPFFGNLREPGHLPLLLCYVVTCFVPDIAHPVANFYGPWGSAKSTGSNLLRSIIDPSSLGSLPLPELRELPQVLYHHWYPAFDNIRSIPPATSDALCRAVTGQGVSRRSLYTDDDDSIYQFRRCLCLNGINLPATEPDLLRRSLLFPLEGIGREQQRTEQEVLAELERVKPRVLGGIFDALSAALRVRPTIALERRPSMADFAEWGCAAAEALGFGRGAFMRLYAENMERQHDEAIAENAVGQALTDFMEAREGWSGTATDLIRALGAEQEARLGKTGFWSLPRSTADLSRQLNILQATLEQAGIHLEFKRDNSSRRIEIRRAVPGLSSSKTDRDRPNAGKPGGLPSGRTTDPPATEAPAAVSPLSPC